LLEVQNQAIEQSLKEAKRRQFVDQEDTKQKKLLQKLEILEESLLKQNQQDDYKLKNQSKSKVNYHDL